jgi:hypothetical protein
MNDLVLKTLAEKWKRDASPSVLPQDASERGREQALEFKGECNAKRECADQLLKLLEILGGEA